MFRTLELLGYHKVSEGFDSLGDARIGYVARQWKTAPTETALD